MESVLKLLIEAEMCVACDAACVCIEVLCSFGADLSLVDHHGNTVLHLACLAVC